MRYHITDIYIDELDKVQSLESTGPDFSTIVDLLVTPFVKLREDGLDKTSRLKADQLLEDPRLHIENAVEDEDEDEDGDGDGDDADADADDEWKGIE